MTKIFICLLSNRDILQTGEFSPPEDAEKMLSSLLQNLRVPHVVASSQAVPGKLDIELKGVMFFCLEDELEANIPV